MAPVQPGGRASCLGGALEKQPVVLMGSGSRHRWEEAAPPGLIKSSRRWPRAAPGGCGCSRRSVRLHLINVSDQPSRPGITSEADSPEAGLSSSFSHLIPRNFLSLLQASLHPRLLPTQPPPPTPCGPLPGPAASASTPISQHPDPRLLQNPDPSADRHSRKGLPSSSRGSESHR